MHAYDLAGTWQCDIPGLSAPIRIPGTLDESGIGFPDQNAEKWHPDANANDALQSADIIATRLTRKVRFEGTARISRRISLPVVQGKRLFVEVERARKLALEVNGQPVPACEEGCLTTPWVFEVTGLLTGDDELCFLSDNHYEGWPHDDIVFSSAATDETQTNWNGLLGYVRMRVEEPTFIADVRVYPHGSTADVCVALSTQAAYQGELTLACDAFEQSETLSVKANVGESEHWKRGIPLRADVRRWDVDEGNLYALTVQGALEARTVRFGVRDFGYDASGHFTLNGRTIFLRSEANCAVFPEEGHCPMTVAEWKQVLETYRAYGVNMMRFHSHTPPDAAFVAADELGMLMQPELNQWNPRDAFETDERHAYYQAEMRQALRFLANHPSFVMMTWGNELFAGETGHSRMDAMLREARERDDTRLYAHASNGEYGAIGTNAESDFYTAMAYFQQHLRATSPNMEGYLNHEYHGATADHEAVMADVRKVYHKPVMSFEVGQYEVLPDFDELAAFRGVTLPRNLEWIKKRVEEQGFGEEWKQRVAATGELSLLCYREEVEAALRTEGFGGISLLGLQDFPGQGTALVGMLNSHLQPKPFDFARPERFQAFFRDALPLALLPRYTWESGETLTAPVRVANYGKRALRGAVEWSLIGEGFDRRGALPECDAPMGRLSDVGTLSVALGEVTEAKRLTLTIQIDGERNTYPVWVYPKVQPTCPPDVYETAVLDDAALRVLSSGGKVYLAPPSTKEALPQSIGAQFSTDFWSVGTFAGQEGGMGQLIDAAHPIFRHFPTDAHTHWQWWRMATQRAVILPRPIRAIVTEMDSYAYLRPMAQLFECRVAGGRLLFSSFGLSDLLAYPEARALQNAIYRYLASDDFAPTESLTAEEMAALV